MKIPVKGEKLVSAIGEVWLVLRCHPAPGDRGFLSVDLISQQDLKHSSRAVNLNVDEFADFCRKQGIAYPPPAG